MDQNEWIWQKEGPLATLQLCRPAQRNALNRSLVAGLTRLFQQLAEDDGLMVLLISGQGDKAFCAGADLKERQGMDEAQVEETVRGLRSCFELLSRLPFVTIARLNGVALGGGLELALACDLRYAHAEVSLGLPETSLAIIPGAGGTQRLPRLIGFPRAAEMILRGQPLSAGQAHAWGLVNDVFPAERLEHSVREIALDLCGRGPLALRAAKTAMKEGLELPLAQALAREEEAYRSVLFSEDRREGLAAFAQRRPPRYLGR